MSDNVAAAPEPPDPRHYRRVIGLFATGVTVIVTQVGDECHGMTANAVTSLSLDPLLLIVCVDKRARMAKLLEPGEAFTVNILREDQETLSRYFAGGARQGMPRPDFDFAAWHGAPRLADCLAALACRVDRVLEGGDHWVVIGRVVDMHEGGPPLRPLLFFGGAYGQLSERDRRPAPELESNVIPIHIYYDPWHEDMK